MITLISKWIALYRANQFLKAWKEKDILKMLNYCTKVYQSKEDYSFLNSMVDDFELVDFELRRANKKSKVMFDFRFRVDILYLNDMPKGEVKDIKLRMIGMSEPYVTSRFFGFGVEVGFLMRSILN